MASLKGSELEPAIHGGIYAIMVDKKIIYIGYTMRPFKKRFQEHEKKIKEGTKTNILLYNKMTDYEKENYKFVILFDIEKIQYRGKQNGGFNRRELKCIECAFIYLFKPKYNMSGITTPYYF